MRKPGVYFAVTALLLKAMMLVAHCDGYAPATFLTVSCTAAADVASVGTVVISAPTDASASAPEEDIEFDKAFLLDETAHELMFADSATLAESAAAKPAVYVFSSPAVTSSGPSQSASWPSTPAVASSGPSLSVPWLCPDSLNFHGLLWDLRQDIRSYWGRYRETSP